MYVGSLYMCPGASSNDWSSLRKGPISVLSVAIVTLEWLFFGRRRPPIKKVIKVIPRNL